MRRICWLLAAGILAAASVPARAAPKKLLVVSILWALGTAGAPSK
jgi:hypothetical protein